MSKRQEFVEECRKYVGAPFRHQGRNPETGLDCAGLLLLSAKNVLNFEAEMELYKRLPFPGQVMNWLSKNLKRKLIQDALPGDVLLLKYGDRAAHTSVLTEKNTLIHAYGTVKRVVEQTINEDYKSRFVAAFEIPGISEGD